MEPKEILLECAGKAAYEDFQKGLLEYVLFRLGLPACISQTDLYQLCLMSLKLQLHGTGSASGEALEERLKKYDCHRTEAAVQKKVLLMMHIERLVAVPPAPGGTIRTLDEFGDYLYRRLRGESL